MTFKNLLNPPLWNHGTTAIIKLFKMISKCIEFTGSQTLFCQLSTVYKKLLLKMVRKIWNIHVMQTLWNLHFTTDHMQCWIHTKQNLQYERSKNLREELVLVIATFLSTPCTGKKPPATQTTQNDLKLWLWKLIVLTNLKRGTAT